jgi:lactate dehydrogenase-like 2-hydroxyacid dehydrogenase
MCATGPKWSIAPVPATNERLPLVPPARKEGSLKVLQLTPLHEPTARALRARFAVLGPEGEAGALAALVKDNGGAIGAIATTGKARVDAELIDSLPALKIIACFGAGTDHVDMQAAKARGVAVTNTGPALAGDVADLAVGMVIALLRQMLPADRFVRDGSWGAKQFPLAKSLRGARLGIVGLGGIGRAVAERLTPFGMDIAYTGPNRKSDNPWRYEPDLHALAEWAEMLVLTCPGGTETRGLIDAAILRALGPQGYLVNVSRGSVVDEPALIAALAEGGIAGAGLDVFANEPQVPLALSGDPRVILAPHMASGTHETRNRMGAMMIDALATHLA